ncbi:MAG: hypothetical protein E6G10_01845 [Actinobacteria bacterium]|nr:MAG: hypothetical protein E6G10_01845 [Actinomycetota bacterium]
MTPPPASAAASTGRHRPATRRGPVPRVPRRVSGAGRPRAVAAAGGAVALPRPLGSPGWGRRALRRLATLADHPLLEIVFMQVSLLKLNAGIGRSVERAAILDRENAELRGVVSELGSDDRLQTEAARMGLVVPPAGAVTFLGRHGKRMGGDGATALATGTATGPQPAGVGAGALAPTPGAASAAATAGAAPGTGATGTPGGVSGGGAGASGTAAPSGAPGASGTATPSGAPGATGTAAPSGAPGAGTTAGAPGATATAPPGATRTAPTAGATVAPAATTQQP